MAKNIMMTDIDGEKLKDYLEKNGISFTELSERLKKDKGYICHSIQKGTMSSGTYDLMCLRLGVEEDYFLKVDTPVIVTESNVNEGVTVSIDYETLKHLMACEYAVDAMLKMATLHYQIDNALFVNNKAFYAILRAYVPEDVDKRLEALREEV